MSVLLEDGLTGAARVCRLPFHRCPAVTSVTAAVAGTLRSLAHRLLVGAARRSAWRLPLLPLRTLFLLPCSSRERDSNNHQPSDARRFRAGAGISRVSTGLRGGALSRTVEREAGGSNLAAITVALGGRHQLAERQLCRGAADSCLFCVLDAATAPTGVLDEMLGPRARRVVALHP